MTFTACTASDPPTPSTQRQDTHPASRVATPHEQPVQVATPAVLLPTANITPTATLVPIPAAERVPYQPTAQPTPEPAVVTAIRENPEKMNIISQHILVQGQPIGWLNPKTWETVPNPIQGMTCDDVLASENWLQNTRQPNNFIGWVNDRNFHAGFPPPFVPRQCIKPI